MPAAVSVAVVVVGIGAPSLPVSVNVSVLPLGHAAPDIAFVTCSVALPLALYTFVNVACWGVPGTISPMLPLVPAADRLQPPGCSPTGSVTT